MRRAELIQRYFDDELAPEARWHVERTISRDEREALAGLAELRALLRGCFAGAASSAVRRACGIGSEAPNGARPVGANVAAAELDAAAERAAQRQRR